MTPKTCSPGYSLILVCIVNLTPCSLLLEHHLRHVSFHNSGSLQGNEDLLWRWDYYMPYLRILYQEQFLIWQTEHCSTLLYFVFLLSQRVSKTENSQREVVSERLGTVSINHRQPDHLFCGVFQCWWLWGFGVVILGGIF